MQEVYLVVPTSVRVELNDLICTKAYMECFVEALRTEEVEQLTVVGAGAEAKDPLYFLMIFKKVRLKYFVLCTLFVVTNLESGDTTHWLLTYTTKKVDFVLSRTTQQ